MKKKHPKIWRYIIILIIITLLLVSIGWTIQPTSTVIIKKWDTIESFFDSLTWVERTRLKLYIARAWVDTKKLQTWTYMFSGSYSPASFMATILSWPTQDYIRYTVLEGWSLYDIDADMAKKWLIAAWEFLAATQSTQKIAQYATTYAFLQTPKPLTTLEWFLYPDTYFLSTNGSPVQQLIDSWLKRFREKIIPIREKQKDSFMTRIWSYELTFSLHWAISLASVIEKEERNNAEKATIAGIFINRLSQDIQLWADITLCYWLKEPYETCTPSVIVKWIYDQNNLYNTRIVSGLPPTPISSITEKTFGALMWFRVTKYLFYLHDNQWNIYYAETNAEHEQNKRLYLR